MVRSLVFPSPYIYIILYHAVEPVVIQVLKLLLFILIRVLNNFLNQFTIGIEELIAKNWKRYIFQPVSLGSIIHLGNAPT